MFDGGSVIEARLQSLEAHLKLENPVLLSVVQSYRELDRVGRRMGLLDAEESFASRISWWPLVAVLGTFSAGKSTFINYNLGAKLQQTGNQAVDDKFTVICFSQDENVNVLPGFALDADPRFPFYQISDKIERVAAGEGRRVDAYLQLKTCPSERVRGKIFIDSPGFDADAQRTSTLRITDHIIDLADLVLVFFDARHPEPGAMHDTLDHLVGKTVNRPDSSKFLYILNQVDTTAREDNPEEVFGAWQRALAQQGLTAGRFYAIYSPDAAVPIDDEALRRRFESKRDTDLAEIRRRMHQVEVERAYRIVGALEKQVHDIEEQIVPRLRELLADWRRRVLWTDGVLLGVVLVGLLAASINGGWWSAPPVWLVTIGGSPLWGGLVALLLLAGGGYAHFSLREFYRRRQARQLAESMPEGFERDSMIRAFRRSTCGWRSLFQREPAGWGGWAKKRIKQILHAADRYVQELNDQFTNPSGGRAAAEAAEPSTVDARAGE
ncbi:dynamin family protein [Endothiovibrio diazotrophicus]